MEGMVLNMTTLFKLFRFGIIVVTLISGCTGYAQIAPSKTHTFYQYQNVYLINTYIGIGSEVDSNTGYITLSDIDIGGRVGVLDNQYIATSDQIGLYFAYPLDGAKAGAEWKLDSCNFSVIEEVEYDSSKNNIEYLQLIETRCDNLEYITRFIFSTTRGLLTITFGDLKPDNSFELKQSFFLMGTGEGFGSSIEK